MTAFKPCLRSLGMRLGGKTAAGVVGLCLFWSGARASAQSNLGPPLAVKEDAERAAAATLGAPRAADGAVQVEANAPAPPSKSKAAPQKKTRNAFGDLGSAPGTQNIWRVGVSTPPLVFGSALQNSAKQLAVQAVAGNAAQEPLPPPRKVAPRTGGPSQEDREPFPPMIRLEVPGTQVLFRLESEEELRERMRQEATQREEGKQLYFPESNIVLAREKSPPPRLWPPLAEVVEPADVGFRRLWFHQINFDRYGWDLGFFQPAVSMGTFYFDILTLPAQFLIDPCRRYEYNTGWCLPGDPAPLALYPFRPK
jgi:hypothetical protein